MEKVIVIGSPGSGKSSFSRRLRDKTELPLFYLDMIWHKPDRTNVTREEFDARLSEICAGERWIIDGNYSRTLDVRLEKCDTVILFDLPTEVCLAGVESRIGTKREDMPWIETSFDPEFREFIEKFRADRLPQIHALIEKYAENRQIIIFKSRAEADGFLNGVGSISFDLQKR